MSLIRHPLWLGTQMNTCEFKLLFAVCAPEAMYLTTCLKRGCSKTRIVLFCCLNSPDKVYFIQFPGTNTFLLCNPLDVLNVHAKTFILSHNRIFIFNQYSIKVSCSAKNLLPYVFLAFFRSLSASDENIQFACFMWFFNIVSAPKLYLPRN